MANKVRVLTSIDDVKPEVYEGEVTREMSITWLIDDLRDGLRENYPEIYWDDIVFEGDTSPYSKELVLGSEQRRRLLLEVSTWNQKIRDRVINIFKTLEGNMVSYPFYYAGMGISEWMDGQSISEIRASIPYDTTGGRTTSLDVAIREMYGYPTYYSDHLVFNADNERHTRQDGTVIIEDTMNSVLKHPENYAIVELVYD